MRWFFCVGEVVVGVDDRLVDLILAYPVVVPRRCLLPRSIAAMVVGLFGPGDCDGLESELRRYGCTANGSFSSRLDLHAEMVRDLLQVSESTEVGQFSPDGWINKPSADADEGCGITPFGLNDLERFDRPGLTSLR